MENKNKNGTSDAHKTNTRRIPPHSHLYRTNSDNTFHAVCTSKTWTTSLERCQQTSYAPELLSDHVGLCCIIYVHGACGPLFSGGKSIFKSSLSPTIKRRRLFGLCVGKFICLCDWEARILLMDGDDPDMTDF
mmetsp:Transcript_7281/g.22174  ORF Transcript_7281/g.22174 Transcript_7281/m.22174 type:complete len:133 (+) Transcript_7281:104-502(+)